MMVLKAVFLTCILSIAQAVVISSNEERNEAPKETNAWKESTVYHPPSSQAFGRKYEHYAYPKYEFEYAVSDSKTGDFKRHQESRDGDRVHGEYSLVEPDGSTRRVQYKADDFNGFNAIVSKTVNKHGDHAYSVSDHTRHFYPVGHGIKINHYFPEKYSNYQNMNTKGDNEETAPKPIEEISAKNEQIVMVDGEKMILKPFETNENDKMENVVVVPTMMTMKADGHEEVIPKVVTPKEIVNEEFPKVEVAKVEFPKMEIHAETPQPEKVIEKIEPADSDVSSSSYYHSKIYYVGY